MTAKKTKESEGPAFGAAMGELEDILQRIEAEEIDIDELAEELKRAAALIEACRDKIRRAELEVTQIVQSLDAAEPPPATDNGEDA